MDSTKYRYYSKVITIKCEDDLSLKIRIIPHQNKVLYIVRNLDVEIYDIPTFQEAVNIYNTLKYKW